MPRITAAIAAVALIVFCIGFNTARYPVVWQMVGASSHLSQPGEPSQPPTTPGPSAASLSEAATQSAASQQSTPLESPTDGQQQYPQQQLYEPWETAYGHSAAARDTTGAYAPDAQPSEVPEYAAQPAPRAAADDDFVPSMSQRPLVRIVHSPIEDDSAAGSFCNPAVRRLPPVDGPGYSDLSRSLPQPPLSPITDYPSTGIE